MFTNYISRLMVCFLFVASCQSISSQTITAKNDFEAIRKVMDRQKNKALKKIINPIREKAISHSHLWKDHECDTIYTISYYDWCYSEEIISNKYIYFLINYRKDSIQISIDLRRQRNKYVQDFVMKWNVKDFKDWEKPTTDKDVPNMIATRIVRKKALRGKNYRYEYSSHRFNYHVPDSIYEELSEEDFRPPIMKYNLNINDVKDSRTP